MAIFERVIINVLQAIYQPFGFAVIMAVFFMFIKLSADEYGWKNIWTKWWGEFKENRSFRKMFFLVFFIVMILFKTLFNRNMWMNPVSDVFGSWTLINKNGELVTDPIENVILFIPFTFLWMNVMRERTKHHILKKSTVLNGVVISFVFSATIEFIQLIFRVGTFQFSDLFYNTLGGLIGGIIAYFYFEIHK